MARRISWLQDKVGPPRFLAFLAIFPAAFALLLGHTGWERALLLGFDAAAILFVLSSLPLLRPADAAHMRGYARENDVNRLQLLFITLVVCAALFVTMVIELSKDDPNGLLVIATLVAAWFFANTQFALHYAYLFWIKDGKGGLDFPHSEEPDFADFAYLSFNLGMTFSTSDVAVTARDVRLIILLHSLAAYAFNIAAIAFSLNVLTG